MTVASNETDSTRLLAEAPCEDSTANLISKQAREETIRLRAYGIYLNRGSENGPMSTIGSARRSNAPARSEQMQNSPHRL